MTPPTASVPSLGRILALAAPIMLSNATTPLVGFVDAVVVGRLGVAHLIGGVAMAAAVFSAVYWTFGFLRMGTTGFTAQAVGAGDVSELGATLLRALVFAVVTGVLLIVLQVPIREAFLRFLGGSADVQAAARAYYDVRIFAAPAGLVNFALLGWFIGLGRTMTAFWLQLVLNIANIVLAVLFTLQLDWGVPGVGLAALIAEWMAAVAGLAVAFREARRRGAFATLAALFDKAKARAMFAANGDILIRSACVLGAFQVFMMLSAGQGDVALAANVLLLNILYITFYLLDGFANAAETLVGQAIGAGDRPGLDATVRLSMLAAGLTGLGLGVVLWASGPWILSAMTTNGDVQQLAHRYLPWAIVMPFLAVWCFQYDGIFIGATRTADMRNMMLVSFAAYLAALALLVPSFANHGLWAAHALFFVVRGATLAWKYPGLADDVRVR